MVQHKVKDLMISNPAIISPESTLKEATETMAKIDCGIMPVGTQSLLVGIITDRDIAIRAVAKGKDPSKTKVSEIMTNKVLSIGEDADLAQAAGIIRKQKVNRLIVKDSKGKVSGIFSLSGLIRESADTKAIAEFVQQLAANNHKKAA